MSDESEATNPKYDVAAWKDGLLAWADRMTPSKDTVLNAATTAFAFDAFIRDALHPKLRPQIEVLLDQPQLSYNTVKRTYSMAFAPGGFQAHVSPMTAEEAAEEASKAISTDAEC
jgi:hypothetical protein